MTETDANKHLFQNPQLFLNIIQSLDPKSYIFQIEEGRETKRLHYQGFVKLNVKKRADFLGRMLNVQAHGIQFIPASDENALIKYCQKEDTRVQGPWSFPSDLRGRRS